MAFAQSSTGRIAGTLTDITGTGVANVSIVLDAEKVTDRHISATNSDGDYVFPDLPAGEYTLLVMAPGFQGVTVKGITIMAGEQRTVPTLRLEVSFCGGGRAVNYIRFLPERIRTGTLSGKIQIDEGPLKAHTPPVAGAQVELLGSGGGTTRTNSNGEFQFPDLYPGDVSILVTARGFYPQHEIGFRVEMGRELNYYPVYMEKCRTRDCNPIKRPTKVAICE